MKSVAIVLAGGGGSRLFPISSDTMPKQFLPLYNNQSLLVNTVNRLLNFFDRNDIFVIGRKKDAEILYDSLGNIINKNNILLETVSLNTAFSILYSTYFIKEKYDDAIINVFSSDHYIKDVDGYIDALKFVNKNISNRIVLLGVVPTYPSTHFGYIKCKNSEGVLNDVQYFFEKPNVDDARIYLKNSYLWNSGTFIFKINTLLDEYSKYLPQYIENFNMYFNHKQMSNELIFSLEPLSIDKAILEKSEVVQCMKIDVGWMDVGTYENLSCILSKDCNNNVLSDRVQYVNSNNCMVIGNKKEVVLMDVDDLIVSVGENKVLIMKKSSDILKLRRK